MHVLQNLEIGAQGKFLRFVFSIVACFTCTSASTNCWSAGLRPKPSCVISPPTASTLLMTKASKSGPCLRTCSSVQYKGLCHFVVRRRFEGTSGKCRTEHEIGILHCTLLVYCTWVRTASIELAEGLAHMHATKPVKNRRRCHLLQKPLLWRLVLFGSYQQQNSGHLKHTAKYQGEY
jgi:hypothetical protein